MRRSRGRSRRSSKRPCRLCAIVVAGVGSLLASTFLLLVVVDGRQPWGMLVDACALFRPLWERAPWTPPHVIPHHRRYALDANVSTAQLCALHGWEQAPTPRRVFDAVLYAGEADLLELRIRELWDVVDVFVVLEANVSFSGRPKPLLFPAQAATKRFEFAAEKIFYSSSVPALKMGMVDPHDDFTNEIATRHAMGVVLLQAGLRKGDAFLTCDVDEIPNRETIVLWRDCTGQPVRTHLILRTFRYSFEFPLPREPNWRPMITVWLDSLRPSFCRGCTVDNAFADAGWHCSWCFRHIDEVLFKMHSYTHSSRAKRRRNMDDPKRIQRVLCTGEDIFGMLPEAHTWSDLFARLGPPKRQFSLNDVPAPLHTHPETFRFLLPGNCQRGE